MMDFTTFARDHIAQLTATTGLVTFALARHKLTPGGIAAAVAVAVIHMLDPEPVFFWLLVGFFLVGVGVTKVGHAAKAHLTLSSTGASGGEGARNYVQVLANSGFACVLILLHTYLANSTPFISSNIPIAPAPHLPALKQILPIGIMAQYAAVAADTFSSELGLLAKSQTFLIIAPWKRVPRGTNGGVTIDGIIYGLFGSILIAAFSAVGMYIGSKKQSMSLNAALLITAMGLTGSVLDSILGATCQATVTDRGTGKVVEGPGGQRVKVVQGGSRVQMGHDLLSNNGVNFTMAALTSLLAMSLAKALDLRL